jgi:hypothetical protein
VITSRTTPPKFVIAAASIGALLLRIWPAAGRASTATSSSPLQTIVTTGRLCTAMRA